MTDLEEVFAEYQEARRRGNPAHRKAAAYALARALGAPRVYGTATVGNHIVRLVPYGKTCKLIIREQSNGSSSAA